MFLSAEFVCFTFVLFFAATTIHFHYKKLFSRHGLPESLPWIGAEDGGPFSRARITLKSFLNSRELVEAGYHKVWISCQIKRTDS